MIIAIPKEKDLNESRVSCTPGSVKVMIKAGFEVHVEKEAGLKSFFTNKEYENSGAKIISDANKLLSESDIILKVNPPNHDEIKHIKNECIYISFFQTTRSLEEVEALTKKSITGFSMHLVPRTTLAQKMDALSSQANIAGYKSVLMAATRLGLYMPLLMTAAGTIRPAKVLILGAGVAGLQAIATAKRLGSQVEVFDLRPIVKEQVESLGAKFIEVESESNEGVGEGGYAKETSDEYKQKQKDLIHEHISKSNIVITTALIPGKPAPLLIPKNMVESMKPGSIIMDLAAENGGNCELTSKDEIITHNQVTIDGTSNIPGLMPVHASELYGKNISALLLYMAKDGEINIDMEDEIISGSMFTHQGKVTNQQTKQALEELK
jgi:NAD(P) transhydrogenase subunit alpha